MIAGLEVGLPGSIADVDAAWMTAVLQTSGAIGTDAAVAAIESEPFLAGGLLSVLFRTTIGYDGAGTGGPTSVIIKFPTEVPAQRALCDAFGVYPREVAFYRDIAPRSTINTPDVYAAMIADDASNYCIVMQDLGHLRQPDPVGGVTWDEAVSGLTALAAFHADWHGSPELDELSKTFISIGCDMNRDGLPGVAAAGWPGAKIHAGHLMSDEAVSFGDLWVDRLPAMLDHMTTTPTLCHEDWRSDNMFIGEAGEIVMIDPQLVGVCNGAFDIGYFISQSVERDVRGGRERELVGHYIDAMAARGHLLDAEQVFFDTRVAVGLCLMYGFASYAQYELLGEQGQVMTDKLLRRCASSLDDFGSLEAVMQLPLSKR